MYLPKTSMHHALRNHHERHDGVEACRNVSSLFFCSDRSRQVADLALYPRDQYYKKRQEVMQDCVSLVASWENSRTYRLPA